MWAMSTLVCWCLFIVVAVPSMVRASGSGLWIDRSGSLQTSAVLLVQGIDVAALVLQVQARVDALEITLINKDAQLADMNKRLNNTSQQLHKTQKDLMELRERNEQLEKKLDITQATAVATGLHVTDLETAATSAANLISSVRANVSALQTRSGNLESVLPGSSALVSLVLALQASNSSLAGALLTSSSSTSSALAALRSSNATVATQMALLQAAATATDTRLSAVQFNFSSFQQSATGLAFRLSDAEALLQGISPLIFALQVANASVQASFASLQNTIGLVTDSIGTLGTQLTGISALTGNDLIVQQVNQMFGGVFTSRLRVSGRKVSFAGYSSPSYTISSSDSFVSSSAYATHSFYFPDLSSISTVCFYTTQSRGTVCYEGSASDSSATVITAPAGGWANNAVHCLMGTYSQWTVLF